MVCQQHRRLDESTDIARLAITCDHSARRGRARMGAPFVTSGGAARQRVGVFRRFFVLLEALASLSHVLQAAGGADDLADIAGRKDHPRDKSWHVDK